MVLDKIKYIKSGYNQIMYLIGIIFLAFSLSWLSPITISKIVGNNIIEPFFALSIILIFYSNHNTKFIIKGVFYSFRFTLSFLTISIFAIIGQIVSQTNFMNVYADYRANIIFIFFLLIINSKKWKINDKEFFLINLLVNIAIMDLIALILRIFFGFQEEDKVKQVISIVIPSVLSLYYLKNNKYFHSAVFTIIMAYEAIVGFLRSYYIVVIVTAVLIIIIVVSNVFNRKISYSSKLKSILLLLFITISCILSANTIYNYWISDGSKMIHSINRSKELLTDADTEQERINSIKVLYEKSDQLIIPHGLGWRNFLDEIQKTFKEEKVISTMDSCLFYLSYHYGILVFIIIFSYSFFNVIKSTLNNNSKSLIFDKKIQIAFLILFLASFFTSGAMLTTPQSAFAYVTLYAIILRPF